MSNFQYEGENKQTNKQSQFVSALTNGEFDEEIFDQILEALKKSYVLISDKADDYNLYSKKFKDARSETIKSKAKIGLNLTTIALTISLIVGIPIGGTIGLRTLQKKQTTVPETTYTYEAGKLPEITTERVELKNAKEKKYIVLAEPYNDLNYRNTTMYDVTDIDLPSVLDYYNLDLSKIENKTESVEYKEDYSDSGSSEETKKLIIKSIDFNDVQSPWYFMFYLLFYVVYILLLIIFESLYLFANPDSYSYAISGMIKNFINKIEDLDAIESEEKTVKKLLEETINDINSTLSKSEELSRRWNEEFERNKDLMSDPSLLLSKYDELIENIKSKTTLKL